MFMCMAYQIYICISLQIYLYMCECVCVYGISDTYIRTIYAIYITVVRIHVFVVNMTNWIHVYRV
jgi:hypothetical protein